MREDRAIGKVYNLYILTSEGDYQQNKVNRLLNIYGLGCLYKLNKCFLWITRIGRRTILDCFEITFIVLEMPYIVVAVLKEMNSTFDCLAT